MPGMDERLEAIRERAEAAFDWREKARRLRLQHNGAFYGPMKDCTCGCDLCEWLVRVIALSEDVPWLLSRLTAAEEAYRQLRVQIEQRPGDTENRDTYADGFTAGLIEAMWLLNRTALSALSSPREGQEQ